VAGGIGFILIILFIVGGSFVYTEKYANTPDVVNRLQPPSWEHPMGTDSTGRDILARVIYGGQISLAVGFLAVIVSVVLGVLIGAFSGYYGGVVDSGLMRFTEAMLAIPSLLILIV